MTFVDLNSSSKRYAMEHSSGPNLWLVAQLVAVACSLNDTSQFAVKDLSVSKLDTKRQFM